MLDDDYIAEWEAAQALRQHLQALLSLRQHVTYYPAIIADE